ncbi:MAG: DUF815 domain-containing protein [Lentisphaerae bacterium]|nr:DUF815 domain-containing protein [Lentisphaerota bacterium]MCP4100398.1 DUF815 domain-containing protein [Lentisphaerota bacterium]
MTARQKKITRETLIERINAALSSLNVLFTEINEGTKTYLDIFRLDFIKSYTSCLQVSQNELKNFGLESDCRNRLYTVVDDSADSIDWINNLLIECNGKSLQKTIEDSVFDVLIATQSIKTTGNDGLNFESDGCFKLQHAERLCHDAKVLNDYLKFLEESADVTGLVRVMPGVEKLFSGKAHIKLEDGVITEASIKTLTARAATSDPFRSGQVFRYSNEKFIPAKLDNIRSADKFYGYEGPRKIFKDHLEDFAQGRSNVPLLVSGLPGLGKTHYAIAYTFAHENLTLILPEPEDIEKPLERLLSRLAVRHDHRFVIFFDDISPDKTNWYYFRTNIGGSLSLPDNVCIVAASNYNFPPNIISRGRLVKFPMFDEKRCMDMVEDFLIEMGMRHCPQSLVFVVAEDYCEQYGQHKFEELSPRTLIRYLDDFKKNLKKRRRMLEMSRAQLIPKPDPQLFYEFNIKLMRSVYGEEAIDALREERLKSEMGSI